MRGNHRPQHSGSLHTVFGNLKYGANMKTLTRRQFIKTVAAGIPVAAAPSRLLAGQKSTRRPNIVYIFADQMRAHVLGCYGNKTVPTPNFDAMAAAGTAFDNAVSTWPVCSPYRAMLLTGMHPMANRQRL